MILFLLHYHIERTLCCTTKSALRVSAAPFGSDGSLQQQTDVFVSPSVRRLQGGWSCRCLMWIWKSYCSPFSHESWKKTTHVVSVSETLSVMVTAEADGKIATCPAVLPPESWDWTAAPMALPGWDDNSQSCAAHWGGCPPWGDRERRVQRSLAVDQAKGVEVRVTSSGCVSLSDCPCSADEGRVLSAASPETLHRTDVREEKKKQCRRRTSQLCCFFCSPQCSGVPDPLHSGWWAAVVRPATWFPWRCSGLAWPSEDSFKAEVQMQMSLKTLTGFMSCTQAELVFHVLLMMRRFGGQTHLLCHHVNVCHWETFTEERCLSDKDAVWLKKIEFTCRDDQSLGRKMIIKHQRSALYSLRHSGTAGEDL